MKEFKATVKIPIYCGRLNLHIVNSAEKYNAIVRKFGYADSEHAESACTIHSKDSGVVTLLFHYQSLGESVISHEATHAADFILERAGARVCAATKEPRAYLQQWIVQWVGKQLVKARMKTRCF